MTQPICICDGRYKGCSHSKRCGNEVTDERLGPWCAPCNTRRFAHIDANLQKISDSLTNAQIHGKKG